MGYVLIIISALFYLGAYSNPSDTVFSDYTESNSIFRPWLQTIGYNNPLRFTEQAALRGRKGFNVICKDPDLIYQMVKFHSNSWQRFYFRIDSLGDSSKASKAFFTQGKQQKEVSFLLYFVSQKLQKDQYEQVVDFKFSVDSKDSGLSLIGTLYGMTWEKTSIPIIRNHVYCVESNLDFFKPESVSMACYIDGVLWGREKTAYLYPHEFFMTTITNDDEDYFLAEYGNNYNFTPFHFSIDEFAFSDKRLYTIPYTASACSSIVQGGQVEMRCRYMQSGYFNEEIKSCRWQVFPFDSLPFPLFDAIEIMPKYFSQHAIPFPLENGKYKWRVCFMNNFGNWGDWSPFTEFTIKGEQKKIIVKNAYFTEKGGHKPISRIIAGQWYDFHLKIDNRMEWGSLQYALVLVNDSSYTFGHMANKGGKFMASSNYVYNLSMTESNYVLFEKTGENSVSSIPISTDSAGVYLDASDHGLVVDTVNGHIKFRVRFLPTAKSGLWQVSAGVVYLKKISLPLEEESNIFRSAITIFPEKDHWRYFRFFMIFVFIAILFTLFIMTWRYRTRTKRTGTEIQKDMIQDPDFQRIIEYVRLHLAEKIVIKDILQECHMSKPHFYNIMNKYNQNLPDIVQKVRIDKAKDMLKNEKIKNIEEICFSVGFMSQTYFSKVFKKIEGISPTEYRNKQKAIVATILPGNG